ncbi:MAG: hypothetical protein R6V04_15330 [bacterium]
MYKIQNPKHQITNKFQITNSNDQTYLLANLIRNIKPRIHTDWTQNNVVFIPESPCCSVAGRKGGGEKLRT